MGRGRPRKMALLSHRRSWAAACAAAEAQRRHAAQVPHADSLEHVRPILLPCGASAAAPASSADSDGDEDRSRRRSEAERERRRRGRRSAQCVRGDQTMQANALVPRQSGPPSPARPLRSRPPRGDPSPSPPRCALTVPADPSFPLHPLFNHVCSRILWQVSHRSGGSGGDGAESGAQHRRQGIRYLRLVSARRMHRARATTRKRATGADAN